MPVKKTKAKRRIPTSSPKKHQLAGHYKVYGYTIVVLGSMLLFVFANIGYSTMTQKQNVLGATLLAKEGKGGGTDLMSQGESSEKGNKKELVFIECHSPDGKIIQTTEKACEQFKKAWEKLQNLEAQGTPPAKLQKKEEKLLRKIEKKAAGKSGSVEVSADGGKVRVKVQDGETEVEVEEGESIVEIDEATDSGKFRIKKGKARANSRFPIAIDAETGKLVITSPNGVKELKVMPDKATEKLLQSGIVDKIRVINAATDEAELEIDEVNGEPVFTGVGTKQERFLGIFPVGIQKKVTISAENGQISSNNTSLLQNFLDFLSF
jgi:hypothetical protein